MILLFSGGVLWGNYIKRSFFKNIPETKTGQTNFLLLGINDSQEKVADLTDTIIFLSVNPEEKRAYLISIPRDLWVPEMQAKANTAYHYGGFELARETVENILGRKIDRVVAIGFDGFIEAIDILGGVEVEVAASFDDYKYPLAGKENDLCDGDPLYRCRYEHVHFEEGKQKMDGQTALKYVRSRNAQGDEGTDFARSLRQQQLIKAVKEKLLTKEIMLSPGKITSLVEVFKKVTKSDVSPSEYGSLLLLFSKIDWNNMKTTSLNENLLTNPSTHSSKQWVLVTKTGDWVQTRQFTEEFLK